MPNFTITVSGVDTNRHVRTVIMQSEFIEHDVEKGEGRCDVMRVFRDPDDKTIVWKTLMGEAVGSPGENLLVQGPDGAMHLTNIQVLSIITPDGKQLIRRFPER